MTESYKRFGTLPLMNWDRVRRERGHPTKATAEVELEREKGIGYIIAAKYAGRCIRCKGHFERNEVVRFFPGRGVQHRSC